MQSITPTTWIAILAAAIWAFGGLLAFTPARALGTYHFIQIQVYSSTIIIGTISYFNGWLSTINPNDWLALTLSGFFGILVTNIAFTTCIRKGGPRRAQVLFTSGVFWSAILGYLFLGEALSGQALLGCFTVILGIAMAVVFNRPQADTHALEKIDGKIWVILVVGIIAGLAQAVGLLVLKKPTIEGLHPAAASTVRLSVCFLAFLAFDIFRYVRTGSQPVPNKKMVLKAVLPGFLGYVVASSLLIYALGQRNTAEVVVLGSLSPLLIIPMQWMVTRQALGFATYAGAALALLGVYLLV